MKRLPRLGRGLLTLYVALALGWLVAWRRWGDRNGLLYLVNSLAFWILGSGWLAGGLLSRSRPWLGLLISETFLFFWIRRYFWMFVRRLPEPRREAGADPVVRILSANLLKKNRDFSPIIAYLQSDPVDVAVFQEMSDATGRRMGEALRARYPYRYWLSHTKARMGLGVFSRIPITVEDHRSVGLSGPFALRLRVHHGDRAFILYNLHLISPMYDHPRLDWDRLLLIRRHQIRRILDDARTQARPVVLMGDWNATEGSDVHAQARADFRDAWAAAGRGPGWTWPHNLEPHMSLAMRPFLRLDHVFCSRELEIVEVQVVKLESGSDHSPMRFSVRIPSV